MNPEFKTANAIFVLDGKVIGEMQTLNAKVETEEIELKNNENFKLFNHEYTATLENVQISEEFVGKLISKNKKFTVVCSGTKIPRGRVLPKKKRIRNKWIKKYKREMVLENCEFV
jgi:flagellar basal body P-ring protein FlgI